VVENAIAVSPNAELGKRASRSIRLPPATQKLRAAGQPATPPVRELRLLGLLSCCDPWRNQAYIVHTGLVAKVDDLGDLAEVEILIALDEHDLLLPSRKDLGQFGLEVYLVHCS